MSRLDTAMKRFSAALEDLQARIDQRADAARAGAESDPERERLLARIAALEEETRDLAGLSEEVEVRLDGAIAEIRSVLDRN
jgi:predicted  nucleic acid-binding Zn-ribbon protein